MVPVIFGHLHTGIVNCWSSLSQKALLISTKHSFPFQGKEDLDDGIYTENFAQKGLCSNNLRSGSIFVSLWKLHSGGQGETKREPDTNLLRNVCRPLFWLIDICRISQPKLLSLLVFWVCKFSIRENYADSLTATPNVLVLIFWLGALEFKILKFLFFCCLNIFLGNFPRFSVHKSLKTKANSQRARTPVFLVYILQKAKANNQSVTLSHQLL